MSDPVRPFRDILDFAIGGGWGKEFVDAELRQVAVIRGTDFADVRFGRTKRVPLRYESDKRLTRRVIQPGDILLEVSGGSPTSGQTTGRSLLVTAELLAEFPVPAIPASFCRLVRVRSDLIDPAYAYYQLQDMYLSGRAGEYENQSTGISNFQFEYFLDAELLRLPPLSEQRAIVEVLGALDDKIELNERMNVTMDEMARALFKSWFVDFDPVRAKAEGRQPSHMDAATAALFPDSFEEEALAPIPAGWHATEIANLTEINGWTLGKNDDLPIIDYIEISEVSMGTVARVQRYERGAEPSRARRRLRHGDTALSTVRPDRGAYFLTLNPARTSVASTGFAVLTPTTAPWSFVHAAMTQREVSERLGHLADGAAYPAVRADVVGQTEVVWGGAEISERFHQLIGPQYELAARNREESRTLAELRDTLLPKLISGEVRIRETAREVEAAV